VNGSLDVFMTKAASGWLIGEPIISADPSVRDVFEMEVVLCSKLCPHQPRLPFERTMDELKFERWRLLVGLTNIPRGPRGLPIA